MNEAIKNANRTKSPEEIAAEIAKEAERRREEELAALKQKEEDEKAARAGGVVVGVLGVFDCMHVCIFVCSWDDCMILQYS